MFGCSQCRHGIFIVAAVGHFAVAIRTVVAHVALPITGIGRNNASKGCQEEPSCSYASIVSRTLDQDSKAQVGLTKPLNVLCHVGRSLLDARLCAAPAKRTVYGIGLIAQQTQWRYRLLIVKDALCRIRYLCGRRFWIGFACGHRCFGCLCNLVGACLLDWNHHFWQAAVINVGTGRPMLQIRDCPFC